MLLLLLLWLKHGVDPAWCITTTTTTIISSSVPAPKPAVCQPRHQHRGLLLVPYSSRV
jgi:hypothetical protein